MEPEGVSRFSVSAPSGLVDEFNAAIRRMGYDRSKAVQLAIRKLLSEWRWMHEAKGRMTGGIVAIYDHRVRGVEDGLTEIQHHNEKIISSSMHIHLDEHHCLEIIAVEGDVKAIQNLAERLAKLRGVGQTSLAIVVAPTQERKNRDNQ